MSPASLAGSAGPSTSCASSIMSPTGSPVRTAARTSVAARSAAARTSTAARSAAARNSATPRSATARTSVATRLAAVRTSIAPVPGGPASRRTSVVPDPVAAGSGSGSATAAAVDPLASGSGTAATSRSPAAAPGTSTGRRPPRRRPRRRVIGRPSRSTSRSSIPGSGRPTEPGTATPVDRRARHDRPGLRQAVALDDAVPGRLLERRRPRPRQRHPAARAQPQAGQRGAQALGRELEQRAIGRRHAGERR